MKIKVSMRFLALSLLACAALSGQGTGVFKDPRDGRIYKTVKIDSQVWFAENLAYKADEGCWAYEDRESNVARFGRLYTFATAKQACPPGWHLPSKQEFEILLRHIGGNGLHAYQELIPSGSSGFAGLFAGFRTARFEYQGKIGHFWSSTEINAHSAWYLGITSFVPDAGISILDRVKESHNKVFGFSVRPVKDAGRFCHEILEGRFARGAGRPADLARPAEPPRAQSCRNSKAGPGLPRRDGHRPDSAADGFRRYRSARIRIP